MKNHNNNIIDRRKCNAIGDCLTGVKVNKAFERLAPIVHNTPLITSQTTNNKVDKQVFFKMENQQKTGSFKFRGASYKLMQLSNEELKKGVIAASAGNHAQGVAEAASKLGVQSTIFMPKDSQQAKVEATRAYGAEVVLVGDTFQQSFEASMERQRVSGAIYVHPFDDYDVMAGQGTLAIEMLAEEKRLDTIIVPIGGGGLISGIAVAAKHINKDIRIIGVQASGAPATYNSYHSIKGDLSSESVGTIAEGISVQQPGIKTLPIIKQYVDDIVTVTDAEISQAILYMLERSKTLMEGAGAAALAALFAYHEEIDSKYCGVIVSGGNIDIARLPQIQELAKKRDLRILPHY